MNYLAIKRASTLLLRQPLHLICANSLLLANTRKFSTLALQDVVNNFYARGEAEEITVASLSKTMNDMMASNISLSEHEQYHPVSDELSYYAVKLLSQHKKPFVSHQQARIFLDFGTAFEVQDRDYWKAVLATL